RAGAELGERRRVVAAERTTAHRDELFACAGQEASERNAVGRRAELRSRPITGERGAGSFGEMRLVAVRGVERERVERIRRRVGAELIFVKHLVAAGGNHGVRRDEEL